MFDVYLIFKREIVKMKIVSMDAGRALRAKAAFTTRRVPRSTMATLLSGDVKPSAGDVVLARVGKVNQHRNIQLTSGRRSRLFEGDEVLLCYGNRYAPDQFEAVIPEQLGKCHMVAGGGIAAQMLTFSGQIKPATEIEALGIIGDRQGRAVNVSHHALPNLGLAQE